MRVLVAAAQALYIGINGVRRWLYRRGILRSRHLPRPVVSIGNISAGGSGKTPATIALAKDLTRRGAKVAVLTRGYGRHDRATAGVIDSLDTSRFGDEPVLIKMRTESVDVIVGSNRYTAGTQYLQSNSCDIFLLDDGFQHLQLARDLDIVIDAPGRFYREGPYALADADIVVPRRMRLAVPDGVPGKRALAFAGLADNIQFFDALRGAGVDVSATIEFPDHHRYTPADLQAIDDAASSAGAEIIVTTEKDAVKIDRRDIIAVPAEFVFDAAVLDRIAALLGK